MKNHALPSGKKGMQPFEAGLLHFKRCSNQECVRPFKMIRYIGQPSGLTDTGKLMCPHCGSQMAAQANSIYSVQALTASEESDFDCWTPDVDMKR